MICYNIFGDFMNISKICNLCPRNCNINRNNSLGFCKASNIVKVARCSLHYYEEPSISGKEGSGAVFFSNCNLKCCFCQNFNISTKQKGIEISVDRLSNIFLELQKQGANNINLVSPTIYILQIKEAIIKAKNRGLIIPIIYNSGGYEKVESLKLLEGLIDIYMPDFKYFSNVSSLKYSKCKDYVENAKLAIAEMYRQVGKNKFNNNNIMTKGLIVRHLIIPGLNKESKQILNYLYNKYRDNIYISIMNQYTPLENVKNYPEINRKITKKEYNDIINYAIELGIENAYVQDDGTQNDSFIPEFDYTGVLEKK